MAELLENGTDIDDGTVDRLQSTALEVAVVRGQIDIIRLLVSQGASQDHLNSRGWSPPRLCWYRWPKDSISGVNIFNILGEYALQDVNSNDSGYHLHTAALYRGAAEICYLIRLGLDTTGKRTGQDSAHYTMRFVLAIWPHTSLCCQITP